MKLHIFITVRAAPHNVLHNLQQYSFNFLGLLWTVYKIYIAVCMKESFYRLDKNKLLLCVRFDPSSEIFE